MKKRVERVRQALVQALKKKGFEIMKPYERLPPDQIPKHDLARGLVLFDLAEILEKLSVEEHPDDEKE